MSTIVETLYTEELYQIKAAVTVVLTSKWEELSAEEKEQLQKIADALQKRISPKLNLGAFRILFQPRLDVHAITPVPEKVIYFGPSITGLGYYEFLQVNGVGIVLSESLADLLKAEPSRQKLWKALQQLFA